jgi:hypothetical protein
MARISETWFDSDWVAGAAAVPRFAAAQMGLLDFPTFVIESSQLDGGSFVAVEHRRDEPVDRLSVGNAIQAIVDDADLDPVGLAPPIAFGWVDVAQIRTVR